MKTIDIADLATVNGGVMMDGCEAAALAAGNAANGYVADGNNYTKAIFTNAVKDACGRVRAKNFVVPGVGPTVDGPFQPRKK